MKCQNKLKIVESDVENMLICPADSPEPKDFSFATINDKLKKVEPALDFCLKMT